MKNKHRSNVNYLFFVVSIILITCSDEEKEARRVAVNIIQSAIPAEGEIDKDIQIRLQAQANNGCYSRMEVTLKEISSRHFLLRARGRYHSENNKCPEVLVYKDTVITFRPESAGEYFFQVNEEPFEVSNYSCVIQ